MLYLNYFCTHLGHTQQLHVCVHVLLNIILLPWISTAINVESLLVPYCTFFLIQFHFLFLLAGLKEAQEKVNDYNPLMTEFPIHKLHATNNLDAINLAVMAIFVLLRKVRTTNTTQLRGPSTLWRLLMVRNMNSILPKFSFMLHVHELKYICIYTHVHVHICHCSLCVHCTVHVYLLYT